MAWNDWRRGHKPPEPRKVDSNMLTQYRRAADEEAAYYAKLVEDGWVWDGFRYTHPDRPGEEIVPG